MKQINDLLKSDIGMMIMLLNIVGLLWYSIITKHPLPDGTAWIIGILWGAKTTHGVMAERKLK